MVCSVCAHRLQAQTLKQTASIAWGMSFPTGGDSYIDRASVENFSLEWGYRVLPGLSAGVSLGYGNRSERGVSDEFFDGSFVSGFREKKLYTLPIMAVFDYFPLGDDNTLLRPYLGVGLGVQYAKWQITGDAIVTSVSKNWAESFSARAGLRISPNENGRFFLDARCLWNYSGNGWQSAKINSMQQFAIMAAAGFMF